MKIIIIRGDTFEGSVWLEADVVDVEHDLAERLIAAGIAEDATEADEA